MRVVHFIPGKDSPSSWISEEAVRLLNLLYVNPPRNSMEWSRLCCRAGLCPVILARTGLTFKRVG
jgi:hypothetical protein